MIIILKKDGTVVTDDGNPVEGVKLENAAAILADPKDGDTIVYDATAGMWVAGTGGGSFEPDITNPQDGDTLVYDASEEKWVNGSGGGSGGGFLKVGVDMETGTLDKTWQEIHDAFADGAYALAFEGEGSSIIIYLIFAVSNTGRSSFEVYLQIPDPDSSTVVVREFVATSENGYPVMQQ